MGMMIIPFVSSLSDDVINAVPQSLRDGSYAHGRDQVGDDPQGRPAGGAARHRLGLLLAVSRAIGETMIVVMAAGLAANLTVNPLEAVTTVTVQIMTLLVGDQEFDSAKTLAAFALGLVLFFVTLALNIIALASSRDIGNSMTDIALDRRSGRRIDLTSRRGARRASRSAIAPSAASSSTASRAIVVDGAVPGRAARRHRHQGASRLHAALRVCRSTSPVEPTVDPQGIGDPTLRARRLRRAGARRAARAVPGVEGRADAPAAARPALDRRGRRFCATQVLADPDADRQTVSDRRCCSPTTADLYLKGVGTKIDARDGSGLAHAERRRRRRSPSRPAATSRRPVTELATSAAQAMLRPSGDDPRQSPTPARRRTARRCAKATPRRKRGRRARRTIRRAS